MHFQALFVSMLLLTLMSCTRDGLDGDGTGKATGKVVMVSLKVSVPPVVEPNSVNGSSGVRALSRNREGCRLAIYCCSGTETGTACCNYAGIRWYDKAVQPLAFSIQ